jgi:hypothetical protein
VSVRDLEEILRHDPAVALHYHHRDAAKLKREARKIGRVIQRGRAVAGTEGQQRDSAAPDGRSAGGFEFEMTRLTVYSDFI